ncbi:MAG: hypothetical protein ACSHWU_08950 [Marinicella sp.]
MEKPSWLTEFVFLQTQWPAISEISRIYPDLESYDLAADWQLFNTTFNNISATPDKFKLLRQFRQSRLAYLAFQDLKMPVRSHPCTMKLVSELADLLIQQAYDMAAKEMLTKHGNVVNAQNETVSLVVYALGKLGTEELNYSSDVDLVLLYSNDGMSDGNHPLTAEGYFVRMGQKIIKLLDHFTNDGQVYRVDMRLRPYGSAGPLACSFSALHQYLLLEGREWERFAWMRARMICGARADEKKIKAIITPFIYRKHLDYGVFSALARIKNEISDHLSFASNDLKQGAGGIRAIEFIVQSMQLVFGGRNTQLQGTSIALQLNQLNEHGQLSTKDHHFLLHAWLWLRKLENISQSVADQNTHVIPENAIVHKVICDSFGQVDWQEMSQSIAANKAQVEHIFAQLFEQSDEDQPLSTDHRLLLNKLMKELPTARMPVARCEQVERLIHKSIPMVTESVLSEFVALLKKIISRPSYLLMLQKESNVHRSVLTLISRHTYFSHILQLYPVLLEQLFEHETFQKFDQTSLKTDWLAVKQDADPEAWMEGLRYFKLVQQFNLIVAWSEQLINDQNVRQQLTSLAQFILTQVVEYSWQETKLKIQQESLKVRDLIVIAYGSAANNQMSISSDLDLVFVLDVNSLQDAERLFAIKWVKKIMHHLGSQMYHGKLYDLDMQLRPNGNSGALVTTRKEFEKYQLNEAWIWEHAAMIKSKALVGDKPQQMWHQKLRSKVLQQSRDPEIVDQELQAMSEKLKLAKTTSAHGHEFTVLAAVLKYSQQYPALTEPMNMHESCELLIKLGLLKVDMTQFITQKKDPAS